MRDGRRAGHLGRRLVAIGALAATAIGGLSTTAASPAAAAPPNMIFHGHVTNVPYGYTAIFAEVIFDRFLAGGTVTWFADGAAIPGCTRTVIPTDLTYSCSPRLLDLGDYAIEIRYSGFGADDPVTTPGGTLRVRQVNTEITFDGPSRVQPFAPTTVSAHINGAEPGATGPLEGLEVSFTPAGGTPCTATSDAAGLASCSITVPAPPAALVIAWAGNAHYRDRTVTVTLQPEAVATSTTVTAVPASAPWGTSSTLTAMITPGTATGTVAFSNAGGPIAGCGAVPVAGGTASCSYALPPASNSVTASYGGDAMHLASSDEVPTLGSQRATSIDLAAPGSLIVGSPTSVSATVHDEFTGGVLEGATVFFALGGASCSAATGASGLATCALTPEHTSDTTLQAEAAATSRYLRSFDTITGLTVAKQATTTTLAPATALYQAPLAIIATVDHGETDGTVDFRTAGDSIDGCDARPVTFAAGSWTATCTTTAFGVGTFPVVAVYSGTADTEGSTSPAQDVAVTPAGTTLTYTGDTTATVDIEPTVSAVLRSDATGAGVAGQPVTFTWASGSCDATTDLDGTATCQLDAPVSAGTQSVTIDFAEAADARFLGSSTTAPIAVAQAATTTTLQVPTSAVYGEFAELVALVSPPGITGTVAFTTDGDPIPGCAVVPLTVTALGYQATCNTTSLEAGEHQIAAAFSGTPDYEPSIAAAQPLTVEPGPTALEYTGDTTGTIGVPATVRARLTLDGNDPATGPLAGHTVTFSGAGDSCSAVTDASGVAECTITPVEAGDRAVTASFTATAEYRASAAAATLVVARISTSTVLDTPTGAQFGEAVRLTAVVAPTDGDGTVTFRAAPDGSSSAAIAGCAGLALELVGGGWTASCETSALPAGALTVTAAYSGGARHLPSSAAATTTIAPAWSQLTYTGAADGTVGAPMTLSAELTAQPGGPPSGQFIPAESTPLALAPEVALSGRTLTFALGDVGCTATTNAAGVASCVITPTTAAPATTVTVAFAGTAQYAAAHASAAVAVAPARTTITVTAPPTIGFSLPVELVAVVSPAPDGGTVTFADGGTPIAGCTAVPVGSDGTARCTATLAPTGTHDLTARYAGSASYVASTSAPSTLTVVPATTALTYAGPSAATVGVPVTVSATLTATGPTATASTSPVVNATSTATEPSPAAAGDAIRSRPLVDPASGGTGTRSGRLTAATVRPLASGIAGQQLTFRLGAVSCVGATDASGTASCTLTPATTADTSLQIAFAGGAEYQAASIEVPLTVSTTPTLPATGSDTSTRLALAAGLLLAGLAATRVRRRRA